MDCSENKGADQLRSTDMRLHFRVIEIHVAVIFLLKTWIVGTS